MRLSRVGFSGTQYLIQRNTSVRLVYLQIKLRSAQSCGIRNGSCYSQNNGLLLAYSMLCGSRNICSLPQKNPSRRLMTLGTLVTLQDRPQIDPGVVGQHKRNGMMCCVCVCMLCICFILVLFVLLRILFVFFKLFICLFICCERDKNLGGQGEWKEPGKRLMRGKNIIKLLFIFFKERERLMIE